MSRDPAAGPVGPVASVREVREVRSQVRGWRRGRASATASEVLSEAYAGLFTALIFGSMLGSVVVNVGELSGSACADAACETGRTLLPWLACGLVLLVLLSLARLFGPVFASPADVTWLLGSPLPRVPLLRPRFVVTLLGSALVGAVATAAVFVLAGMNHAVLPAPTVVGGATALLVVAGAAVAQGRDSRLVPILSGTVGVLMWATALTLALGVAPSLVPPTRISPLLVTVATLLVLGASVTVVLAVRRLPQLRGRDLASGGALVPGLSGALATLDLALVYDVVLAHRWRARGSVRSRRGGPSGAAALAWADVVRVRRRPQPALVLAALVVLPWAAAAIGFGPAVVPLAVVAGFLGTLPMLGAVRVMTRTPSLLRAVPFSPPVAIGATCVVPALLALAYGLLSAPALADALHLPPEVDLLAGLAVGAGAFACAMRWVTGRPPDYAKPLVATPAGAVPTNLYGSVLRGFDVALLVSVPLLLVRTDSGALISLGLSVAVVVYLVGRPQR